MDDRMPFPLFLQLLQCKAFEKLFLTSEIGSDGGDEQRLSETVRTAEKNILIETLI